MSVRPQLRRAGEGCRKAGQSPEPAVPQVTDNAEGLHCSLTSELHLKQGKILQEQARFSLPAAGWKGQAFPRAAKVCWLREGWAGRSSRGSRAVVRRSSLLALKYRGASGSCSSNLAEISVGK